jgi:hypothetical protein
MAGRMHLIKHVRDRRVPADKSCDLNCWPLGPFRADMTG